MNKKTLCILLVLVLLTSITTSLFLGTLNMGKADNQSSDSNGDPTSWPMFHYNLSHTGNTSSSGPLTNQTAWIFGTDNDVYSSPAVADGLVYIGDSIGVVYALDASTGSLKWSHYTGSSLYSSPAVADGAVYMGSGNSVSAFNSTNGTPLWNYTGGNFMWSSPSVSNGIVYIGSNDGNEYALNASTGVKIWNFETSNIVNSSAAVVNNIVYFGSWDGNVYALDATTGAQIWNYTIGGYVSSSPAVAYGVVYIGQNFGPVFALNATNGKQLWNYTMTCVDSPAVSTIVSGNVVYVGSGDGYVFAFNAASGIQMWNYSTGTAVQSSPAVANGIVYVGSNDGNLNALNASTGSRIWNYLTPLSPGNPLGHAVRSSPAIANGVVYVGCDNTNVYAFGPQSPGTNVTGTISTDTTWTQANSPYILTGNILVSNNVILTVQPGVTVNLSNYFIGVNGTLRAVGGDGSNQIVFNGGDISFWPSSNAWNQSAGTGNIIANAVLNSYVVDNSSARISRDNITMGIQANAQTIIENSTITGGIDAFGDPIISNNVISGQGLTLYQNATVEENLIVNNNVYGVELFAWEVASASSPLIQNNTITQNGDGIYLPSEPGQPAPVFGHPSPIIALNNIYGNNYNILSAVPDNVTAADNWWGTTNQAAISATISGNVTFIPFLTQPNSWAPTYNPNPNPTPTPTPIITPSPTPSPPPHASVNILTSTGGVTDPSAGTYGYANGTTITLTATPGYGYIFQKWYIVSSLGGNSSFTDNPHSFSVGGGISYTVQAIFILSTPPPSTFSILSMALGYGAISPNGTVSVPSGNNLTYTITPNNGYQIANVLVNGSSVGTVSTYIFTNVQANYVIEAFFTIAPTPTPTPSISPSPSPTSAPTPTSSPSPSPTPKPQNTPTIDFSCLGSTSYSNFKVDITGSLSSSSSAIANAPILLSDSVNNGISWIDLTTVYTDNNGLFSASWTPQVSGYYLMKAVYDGNAIYSNTSKIVNFALAPLQAQTFFSVSSNSTLTSLYFNSSSNQLSFATNGDTGTTGYVSVSIPKSLVSQASSLQVFLDGTPITYSSVSQDNSWLITFTYHQSSHQVAISLGSTQVQDTGISELVVVGAVAALVGVIIATLVVWRIKRRRTTG